MRTRERRDRRAREGVAGANSPCHGVGGGARRRRDRAASGVVAFAPVCIPRRTSCARHLRQRLRRTRRHTPLAMGRAGRVVGCEGCRPGRCAAARRPAGLLRRGTTPLAGHGQRSGVIPRLALLADSLLPFGANDLCRALGTRPAGGRHVSRWGGTHHRPSGIGQDASTHRTCAAPAAKVEPARVGASRWWPSTREPPTR